MKHIIHFTSEFKKLKAIIESKNLRLHYCKEDFCIGDKIVSRAVHPMVSFSEYYIPNIDNENITYGKYGIAFSRKWVEKRKIHQVLYLEKNSTVAKSLANLLVARRKNATTQLSKEVRHSIIVIKCFTKNARGYNSHFKVSDYDFRSENEWRFVPTKKQIGGSLISQDRSKFIKNQAAQDFYNNQLIDYHLLTFGTDDIEYLFVETEEESIEIQKLTSIDRKKIKISQWKTELKR